MLALRKRPVSAESVDEALQKIKEKLLASGEREVITGRVGELVMHELKQLDKIAYIRFASVYKSFEDVAEFQNMIEEFSGPTRKKNSTQLPKFCTLPGAGLSPRLILGLSWSIFLVESGSVVIKDDSIRSSFIRCEAVFDTAFCRCFCSVVLSSIHIALWFYPD